MVTRIEHNVTTGQVEVIPCDDSWLIANRPKTVELSISDNTLSVGQSATLTAQLKTPYLNDGSRQNVADNLSIRLHLGDVDVDVNLVGGIWSDSLQFDIAGNHELTCLSHESNVIIVEVT